MDRCLTDPARTYPIPVRDPAGFHIRQKDGRSTGFSGHMVKTLKYLNTIMTEFRCSLATVPKTRFGRHFALCVFC